MKYPAKAINDFQPGFDLVAPGQCGNVACSR